jgi:hypothetical protein
MVLGFGGEEKPRWLMITIVVLSVAIAVIIIMMLAGYDFAGLGTRTTAAISADNKVFWKRYDPMVPLRVTASEVMRLDNFDRYTMMVDMMWVNTRVTSESNKYRHILHRGSGEAADFLQTLKATLPTAGAPSSAKGPTRAEVLARMPQGLPVRMNPGIMADPVTNDMLIFIDTVRDNANHRESVRIPDIPMGQGFQLALVVLPNVLEVYINCRLEVTKLLEGRPLAVESPWYGLTGPEPLNAALQNLRIFNSPLGYDQISAYCRKPVEFPESAGTCQAQS